MSHENDHDVLIRIDERTLRTDEWIKTADKRIVSLETDRNRVLGGTVVISTLGGFIGMVLGFLGAWLVKFHT